MQHKPVVLARYKGFGSVSRCLHGCIHVQLGMTTFTLSDGQYQHFVAMLNDSAANFEFFRHAQSETEHSEELGADGPPAIQ